MNTEQIIKNIREELIGQIKSVVEKHGGCIGTFYKNIGVHHTKIDYMDTQADEYEDSPVVVIKSDHPGDYGYVAAHVFDIFIDPDDSSLTVTLNGESYEDFDELLELVQVEGLHKIADWLASNGFLAVPDTK